MVAIMPGIAAPNLALRTVTGESLTLKSELANSPVVLLAFFKVSCPVCQFSFPYIERLHRSYPNIPIWGISQDDLDSTTAFANRYGCSFPILLDQDLSFTVEYGLISVPSIFLVGKNGNIEVTSEGFVKADLEEINERLAKSSGVAAKPLFTSADEVPAVRPG